MTTLLFIKRALRAGKHPKEFGAEACAGGGQRHRVWLYGDYIIKDRAPAWALDEDHNCCARPCASRDLWRIPRRALKRVGLHPPQQWYVGRWVIQLYYRPLNAEESTKWSFLAVRDTYMQILVQGQPNRIRLDLHPANIGVHPQHGTVHAYDW